MNKIIFNSKNKVRPIWRLLLFLFITFAINIPLQIGLQKILDQSLFRGYISGSIYFVSVLLSLFVQIKYLDKSSFEKYGLKLSKKWVQEFFVGCAFSLLQLSLFFLIMYLTGNLKIVDYFTTQSSDFTFIEGFLSEVFSLIIGTSVEEIFFRAFLFYILYEVLRNVKKDPAKRAILVLFIISIVFGIAHMDNEGATFVSTINLGLYGIILCLPFLITGRLGMSTGMHFSWNLVQGVFFGFAVSGNSTKVSIISVDVSNNALTGGVFGPEGSLLFLFICVIAVALLLLWKKIKGYSAIVNPLLIKNDI
ncbi:lysostaphin resistance A-like protein [Aquimarina macrocephali]|uniref:CPBP family intramembrane glutamic endopeptidase n=1 Tax=Aquimarina macrocephali TaxID=666563 RepID=UPI003F668184